MKDTINQQDAGLLTKAEAAGWLKISTRQVDNYLASGDLPAVRLGRSVRFRPSSLKSFSEARESRMSSERLAAVTGRKRNLGAGQ